jgi:hypothetical protein
MHACIYFLISFLFSFSFLEVEAKGDEKRTEEKEAERKQRKILFSLSIHGESVVLIWYFIRYSVLLSLREREN